MQGYFYQYLVLKLAKLLVRTVAGIKDCMYRPRVYLWSQQPDDNDSILMSADTSNHLTYQFKTKEGFNELDRHSDKLTTTFL